jgi:hypothetical protein
MGMALERDMIGSPFSLVTRWRPHDGAPGSPLPGAHTPSWGTLRLHERTSTIEQKFDFGNPDKLPQIPPNPAKLATSFDKLAMRCYPGSSEEG